jgi:alpha-1,4-digalacturonate transport system substrate-binding protein
MSTTFTRRQILIGGLSGAAVIGLTAACGSDSGGSGGSADPSEVGTLQFFLSGDANQGGGFAAMAAKYEKETGFKVEIVDIANDDLGTRLTNAAQANDLPALARVGSVDPVWKNATKDLAEIMTAAGVMADLSTQDEDGRVFSLPTDVTGVGLFINKSLFDEAGVEFPADVEGDVWSWDDFVSAVKQVQEATGASYGMAMDASSHRLKSFLYEFGSTLWQPDGSGTFTTNDATKAALEYFYEINDDSFMPRSVWLSEADGNALFKSGDVVAYYSGSWQIADFAVNIADFEWASVPTPRQPVQAVNFGNAASIVVFDGTGQEQAALDFVSWLYTKENYTELATTSGFLPAVNGITVEYADNAEAFDLYNAEIAASDPIVTTIKQMELGFEVAGLTTEGDPLRDQVVRYLNDEIGVDECITTIGEQMTEAFGSAS